MDDADLAEEIQGEMGGEEEKGTDDECVDHKEVGQDDDYQSEEDGPESKGTFKAGFQWLYSITSNTGSWVHYIVIWPGRKALGIFDPKDCKERCKKGK